MVSMNCPRSLTLAFVCISALGGYIVYIDFSDVKKDLTIFFIEFRIDRGDPFNG